MPDSRAGQVVFSEVMYHPAGTQPEFLEVWNLTSTPLDIAKWRFASGISFEFPDFVAAAPQAHLLKAGERIVISPLGEAGTRAAYPGIPADVRVFGPWTGTLDNNGEALRLEDKNGVPVCELEYKDGGSWPKAADGAGHSLVLRSENNDFDNFRNWRQSRMAGGTPGYEEFATITPYAGNPEVASGSAAVQFDYNTPWRWNLPATDPGQAWRATGFDDSAWSSGPALLGFETAGLPAPGLQTAVGSASASMVYLFRKSFTFSGNPAGATFAIDQIVDDGVVYYLNGQLLGSVGHNPAAWDAGASRTVGDATEELSALSGNAANLVNGNNVLAAEVHQTNLTSSDMVFGARLKIGTQASVVINEVKPGAAGQGFVEFYNTTGTALNLQNHYLSDNPLNLTKFRINDSLPVPPAGFATVGFAESNLTVGPATIVYLTGPGGVIALSAINAAIPLDGRSLERSPQGGASWVLTSLPSPGGAAPGGGTPVSLRLSEVHFDGTGMVDWVELENAGTAASPASGLFIASAADFSDKVPVAGSVAARGFASWTVNFAPDASGELELWLIDSANNVLDVAELKRVPARDSLQAAWPVAVPVKPGWQYLPERPWWNSFPTDTRNAANPSLPSSGVVINEIMPDPPSGHQNAEFIELFNRSPSPLLLTGWKLRGGVDFDFLPGTTVPAGGYLVVGRDPAALQAVYPSAVVAGPWSGSLGNRGDLIRVIDPNGNLADEVDYQVGGDWPGLAAAQGSSLELIHPGMENSRSSAWRASVESSKTTWQPYTISGVWPQLTTQGAPADYKELHLHLVGDGHLAVRNMSLKLNNAGANLLPGNGAGFSTDGSAAAGWLCQGTHAASYVENAELHLVADGHGDNRPNRAELDVTGMNQNGNYTLTFEARWISGKNRLIVQTWDHSFGRSLLLPIPDQLGSAGAANSVLTAAPLPQVDSLLHRPAVPKPADPVIVTARVTSVNPLTAVEVVHRADDAPLTDPPFTTPMSDNGTAGDAVANDGLYTAIISSHQVNGRIVNFYVRATAVGGAVGVLPRRGADLTAHWVVDSRVLDARLRRQRFVISAYDRNSMVANGDTPAATYDYQYPRLSNRYVNATFISNETDVYYNAEIRKSGSPWTRSSGEDLSRGKWKVPRDRFFRGREKSTYDNDAEGGSRHHNRLTRYWLYVLGHPGNESEFVYHVVNTDGLAIREDTEPVDGEFVGRAFPGGGKGQLFRSDDEWWFSDDWSRSSRNADWSYKSTDSPLRYHTEWMARSREEEHDYSALTDFFRTVSNTPNYPAATYRELTGRMLDSRLALMMAAVRGYTNDWDSFTLDRGKNGFFYRKPDDGRFMFLHWDSDLAFGDANGTVVGGLAGWATYISQPWARRTLNYYLSEMLRLTTGSNSARTAAWLDAEEAASAAWSVDRTRYNDWMTNRQARILTEINAAVGSGGTGNAATAPFAVTTPSGTTALTSISLSGTAPATADTIIMDGHPEAVLTWNNQTSWRLSGILLREGLNSLTVRMLDAAGQPVGAPLSYAYTKMGNAPPAMQLSATPASWHVGLGQTLTLNAGTSFDPEGTALSYTWNWTPGTGSMVASPLPYLRTAVFTTPGLYQVTATGTDEAVPTPQSAAQTREITVFNTEDFESFKSEILPPVWTLQALERRDNYSPASWYSLEDQPGKLLLQVRDDAPHPLAYASPAFPSLFRPLPASQDFVLETNFDYDGKRTGSAFAGVTVEVIESGVTIKYAFGVEGGINWWLKRSSGGSFANQGTALAFTGTTAVLRVRRSGTQLLFERRFDEGWTTVRAQTLPAGSTVIRGGPFMATSTAENARMAFDYVLLADPGNTNSQLNNLRITELMYSPKAPATAEWIEIKNTGPGAVSLLGVRFPQGNPFDELVLPDLSLATGQSAIVTSNTAAFQTRYGTTALVAAQWSAGALSNGGELVRMLDADGNSIHEFTYDDFEPWPVAPRGLGPSLEVISTAGNYGDPLNWRASSEPEGSPGTTGVGPDTDGDGIPDSVESWFGTNPADPGSIAVLTLSAAGRFSFPTVPGHAYRVCTSSTLAPSSWLVLETITATAASTSFIDSTTPLPDSRFYRVEALLP